MTLHFVRMRPRSSQPTRPSASISARSRRTSRAKWASTSNLGCSMPVLPDSPCPGFTAERGSPTATSRSSTRRRSSTGCPPGSTRSPSACAYRSCSNTVPRRNGSPTCRACCRAKRSGARCSASPARAAMWPGSPPEQCATVTSSSSTGRRCGPPPPTTPRSVCACCAPIRRWPSTRVFPW